MLAFRLLEMVVGVGGWGSGVGKELE